MKNLSNWDKVKSRIYDTSKIDNPEKWMFENVNGIYYPVEMVKEKVVDEMYEKLDPDMSDKEMEDLGLGKVIPQGRSFKFILN